MVEAPVNRARHVVPEKLSAHVPQRQIHNVGTALVDTTKKDLQWILARNVLHVAR